ncbi:MAG: hypothetical protein NUV32_00590 [Exilispira sp.]|jgi:hypothetical protein|nr:hypothetical protein [Exilispira sp.]
MKKMLDYKTYFMELLNHVEEENYKGIDPSSIKFNDRIINLTNKVKRIKFKPIKKIILYLFFQIQSFFNPSIVKKLDLNKQYFTKGLALISSALANFDYNLFKNKIEEIIEIILSLKIGDEFVWAHNIDYYFNDDTKITTSTPNLITTYFVANAFFEIYSLSKEEKYLNLFNKTVITMLEKFPYDRYSEKSICFMYTPNSNYHVHNANILFVEILVKYIFLNKNEDNNNLIELVRKALNYSLEDFKNTHTFPYAGPPTRNFSVDNYHLGYVLRGLNNIIKLSNNYLDELKLKECLLKGISLYFKYFVGNFVYKLKKKFFLSTVESHSLAEAYLIYIELNEYMDEKQKSRLLIKLEKTLKKLWDSKHKYFYNNIKILFGLHFYDKTDMIRWSNSWMLYSISKFIKSKLGN